MGKGIKLVSLIVLAITFSILILYIDLLLYPDSIIVHNFIDDHDHPETTYFDLEYQQDQFDYSYKIDVIKASGPKIKTNAAKLSMSKFVDYSSIKLIYVDDFKSTKEFVKNTNLVLIVTESPYYEDYQEINLSSSITYFDLDDDNYISKDDCFIILFKNVDNNEFINLSQYKKEWFNFYINDEDDNCMGMLKINRYYPDNEYLDGEIIEYPPETNSLCYIPIIIISAFLIIQLFFFVRILKNKSDMD